MLLEINFTLIFFAVSFLIFIYLLNLTLYKPVGEVIEKRKGLIDGEYTKAKELTDTANKILDNYKKQIKSARFEAQNIIQETIKEEQKKKEEKITLLMTDLNKEKEKALKQIKEEQINILNQLQKELTALAELITAKILGGQKSLVGTH